MVRIPCTCHVKRNSLTSNNSPCHDFDKVSDSFTCHVNSRFDPPKPSTCHIKQRFASHFASLVSRLHQSHFAMLKWKLRCKNSCETRLLMTFWQKNLACLYSDPWTCTWFWLRKGLSLYKLTFSQLSLTKYKPFKSVKYRLHKRLQHLLKNTNLLIIRIISALH